MTLVAEHLRVAFPTEGLVPISEANFQVAPGRVLALCGANGSGKSTLARAILGLIPDLIPGTVEGHLTWIDNPLPQQLHQRLGLIGYTFQDVDSQILFGTVADVLGLNEHGGGGAAITNAIGHFGIASLLGAVPDRLSGGQKQIVALISALRRNPPVLIFDEAISALDPLARRRFAGWTNMLRADGNKGKAIMLIGQDPNRLASISDVVCWLENGRTVPLEERPPAAPQTEFWADFMETIGWNRPVSITTKQLVLRRRQSQFVVGPLDFEVAAGEIVALVGPNGCGKSTLLAHLAGQLSARAGDTQFRFSDGSLADNAVALLIKQMPYTQIIGASVAEELGIEDNPSTEFSSLRNRFTFLRPEIDPLLLSFGQQRMLRFLSAVITRPNVMFIDEPEQGLNSVNLESLETFIALARVSRRLSVVFATHDLDLASRVADRVLFMAEGHIIAETTTDKTMELEAWYLRHAERFH